MCMTHNKSASPSTSMSRSDTYPGPAIEAPQRISLYSREPRRLGQLPIQQTSLNTPSTAPKKKTTQQPYSQKQAPAVEPTNPKFQPKELADSFVPWPSIEEVKAQRAQLYPQTLPPRGRSPPKMMARSQNAGPSHASTSEMQPTRFRISVSPTRKLQPDSSGSDNESGEASRRRRAPRYIIKQQPVIAGSSSSFGSRVSVEQPKSIPSSPQAPRVVFGSDDDSPRVEEQPSKFRK